MRDLRSTPRSNRFPTTVNLRQDEALVHRDAVLGVRHLRLQDCEKALGDGYGGEREGDERESGRE